MNTINYNQDEIERKCFDALIVLMEKKPIEQCHTSEILEIANISKSTFYRHYIDKYDLLNRSYHELLKHTFYSIQEGSSYKTNFIQLYTLLKANQKFFYHAFLTQGANSLRDTIYNKMEELFNEMLFKHGIDVKQPYYHYLLEGYLSGTLQITYDWLISGANESTDTLLKLVYSLMPEEIKTIITLYYM